jgi:hypothetical protein
MPAKVLLAPGEQARAPPFRFPRDARTDTGVDCVSMWRAIPALLLLAGAAPADDDPPGTVRLDLVVGQTSPLHALPGSRVICDDPLVVTPEFTEHDDGFVLRALKPGSTLCGVWLEAKIGGLYRVRVAPKAPAAGKSDGGPEAADDRGRQPRGSRSPATVTRPPPWKPLAHRQESDFSCLILRCQHS